MGAAQPLSASRVERPLVLTHTRVKTGFETSLGETIAVVPASSKAVKSFLRKCWGT